MHPPQCTHHYADVDDPNISFLARQQSISKDDFIPGAAWPVATILASHPANTNGSADCSSGSLIGASSRPFRKELELHSSESWDDAPEPILFSDCHLEQSASVFPKKYVPFNNLLDDSKKMGAAEQGTSLCTSWMTFSAGTQADSILILNSSLSVAVQFFSDCSHAPRLRTIVPSKPLNYTICKTGVLAEFQSSAILPIWSGDPRFCDSNQRVVFGSWVFWRERSPSSSSIFSQSNAPIYCTVCSSSVGRAFRFHFLSNGELIVIGSASGFMCRGSNIIADRDVALSAFQNFKTCSDLSGASAVSILPGEDSSSHPKFNIYYLCQMAATAENFPVKSSWKSGENLYDRLMISKWASQLIKLVTRAALDISASDTLFDLPGNAKRQKVAHFVAQNGCLADQSWEEYQELESLRERDDRIYAQRLQDQEIAAARLNALRSRRGDKNTILIHETRPAALNRNDHNEQIKASPAAEVSSASLNNASHSDVISDSDSSLCSHSSSSVDACRLSAGPAGHKIRFVFKSNLNDQSFAHRDSPSISEAIALQSQNLFEVCLF